MAITYIDTAAKEVKTERAKSSKSHLKLFLKTVGLTILGTVGILVILGLILGVFLYPKARALQDQINKTYSQANLIKADLKDKDIKKAEVDLTGLKAEMGKTRDQFNKLSFTKHVPILASYYNDGEHLLNAADIGVELGQEGLKVIEPFGDVLGFKGTKTEVTAEKKAEVLVKDVIPKLIPLVDSISEKLTSVQAEVDQIDPGHYPASLQVKGVKVQETLKTSKDYLAKAQDIIPQIKPLLLSAPEIAGEPNQKTYLMLFQNDKELRPTGGFITSYALANVKGGRLLSVDSDDIYQLDLKYNRTETSPVAISKYLGNYTLPIRDSNFSPDYKVAAMKFESMYNTIRGMPKVSGVFALDTEFVRSFLEVTGPITTKKTKETFSAVNNRLGIPDVVYKLELHAEKIKSGQVDRKGILGELMNAMIEKVLSAKTDQLPKYINNFIKEVNEKHILFYFHDQAFQDFAEKYNAAGIIKDAPTDSDYFHLNNANFGGLKGNLYIKQKVLQNITVSDDGTVTKKVDVTLTNPVKADGWLSSIYLNWMRIFVPLGSTLIDKKVYKDFTSTTELGKQVYAGYGPTYPLNFSVFTFTYQLPAKVDKNQPYKMMIQKQPGVDQVQMIIKINGVTKEDFMMRTDRQLSIPF